MNCERSERDETEREDACRVGDRDGRSQEERIAGRPFVPIR